MSGKGDDCPRKWTTGSSAGNRHVVARDSRPAKFSKGYLAGVFALRCTWAEGARNRFENDYSTAGQTTARRTLPRNLFVYANGQSTVAPPLRHPPRLVSPRVSAITCFSSRLRPPTFVPLSLAHGPFVRKITPPAPYSLPLGVRLLLLRRGKQRRSLAVLLIFVRIFFFVFFFFKTERKKFKTATLSFF